VLGLLPLVCSYINAHFCFAYVQRDCAANDALALNFYFTLKKNDCVSRCQCIERPFHETIGRGTASRIRQHA